MQDTNEAASVTIGEEAVGGLRREWVFGWERVAGDAPFSFRESLGRFYDWYLGGVMLYGDFDAGHRVAHSAAECGAIPYESTG